MEISTMAEAMQLHAQILKSGSHYRDPQENKLAKLFSFSALSPAGDINYARKILDSLRTPNSYYHNTMIRAYSDSNDPTRALTLFLAMHGQPEGSLTPRPDNFTFPFVLKACSRLKHTRFGKQLHGLILKSGFGSDRYINNALVHYYMGCGDSGLALKVFDEMSDRDVVSWTSVIDGLVDNDQPVKAIVLFEKMVENGFDPNEATVVSVLRACSDAGALSVGQKMHKFVKENKIILQATNVRTALIDMYSKCGCIETAICVFDEIEKKDVFAFTAMIASLASHGRCKEAIELFDQMHSSGVKPDERTITAVLSACRNAGWLREGLSRFKSMGKKYKIRPTIQHYGCVVDMLARAGHLKKAEAFIRKMAIEPDTAMWRNLLWACKVHRDLKMSENLMRHLELLKHNDIDSGNYVLLGNVYASTGKWHEKAKIRELMTQRGLAKPPGFSRIEIDGVVHEFAAGYSGHFEAENIFNKLNEIEERLRREGYDPKLSEVLLDVDDEEKAFQLLHHSEKLALSYGLLKSSPRTVIRIVKNLRSCEDCHSFMKYVSKIYQIDIIIRDRIRFHYFSKGDCSCGDYW